MRQDSRRAWRNRAKKEAAKKQIKKFQKTKGAEDLEKAMSMLDKMAKTNVIHKNKAARLKSRLAKQIKTKPATK